MKTQRAVDSWRHSIGVKSELLNPSGKIETFWQTLLKHGKVLVEENLRAPRTFDPSTWKTVIFTQRIPFLC